VVQAAVYAALKPRPPSNWANIQWCYQGLWDKTRTRPKTRGQGRGLETKFKSKAKKLEVKTNYIQKPLPQWHITVNWS